MRSKSATDHDDEAFPALEERQGWAAWTLSLAMHATVLIAIALLAPAAAQPPPGESDRTVGIALVPRSVGEGPGDGVTASTSAAAARRGGEEAGEETDRADREVLPKLPGLDSLAGPFGASLPQAASAGNGGGAPVGLPDATGFLAGATSGPGRGTGGGQARTQVFGATGEGSKFVYVFDRSASMGGFDGRPLAAAQRELSNSLRDLSDLHQFQIVFYNDRPSIFNPSAPSPPTILFATEENRRLAASFIGGIAAAGGTRHREALEAALRMGPDVIFFLTDAHEPELSPGELADLGRRNRAAAIIHCIEFGVGAHTGDENFLVRLARQNRGQYVYVDVTKLGSNP